jgi:hypothetical protein
MKMEVLNFLGTITLSTGGTQTGVDDADTFSTLMVRPQFALVVANDDASDTAWETTFSDKTVTLTNTSATAVDVNIIVFGF